MIGRYLEPCRAVWIESLRLPPPDAAGHASLGTRGSAGRGTQGKPTAAANCTDVNGLHDRVGQRFVVDFQGTEVTPGLERLLREGRAGGVILFAGNIASAGQVRTLTRDLQAVAADAGLPPLWISVDQEGGIVNRIVVDFPVFPSAMAIGATGDEEAAATAGRVTGRALRALGFNVNHAPVLDVNTNPDNPIIGVRSFGEDPDAVARLGSAYTRALRAEGVLATAKHFPGHGDATIDSHLDLPIVGKPQDALEREELLPFRATFAAGADGVMTAHIVYPALDAERPATLSSRILSDLLRGKMGFEGVVFTDAMSMKAVANRWTRGDAAVAALRAGADIVMACGTEAEQWASIEAVRTAAADGALDAGEMARSVSRIQRVNERYAGSVTGEGHPSDFAEAQAVADGAVTLIRDRTGSIPLRAGRTAVVHLVENPRRGSTTTLGHELLQLRANVEVVEDPDTLKRDAWANVVVASLAWPSCAHAGVIRELHARFGARLIVVGLGNPYELARFPDVDTYLATYGPDPASLRAAARVLTGELTPAGRLPVTIPGLYPRGHREVTNR